MQVKNMDRIKKRWSEATAAATSAYEDGIKEPKKDWADETSKAENNYKTGVTAAMAAGRFGKGVKKAGTAKWQKNSLAKGPGRWTQGVSLALDEYENGFKPYLDVLAALTLPERGAKGDPKNINRVAVVAKALNDKKKSMTGG